VRQIGTTGKSIFCGKRVKLYSRVPDAGSKRFSAATREKPGPMIARMDPDQQRITRLGLLRSIRGKRARSFHSRRGTGKRWLVRVCLQ
jgi:hypothetical protein